MSYNEQMAIAQITEDMRTHQWKAANATGARSINTTDAIGISATKADSGEDSSVTVWGRSKFAAGGAVAAGARLKVASGGWIVTANSGDVVIGRNYGSAVSSGGVGNPGFFNFVAGGYQVGSA